jgi:hypothetical protein
MDYDFDKIAAIAKKLQDIYVPIDEACSMERAALKRWTDAKAKDERIQTRGLIVQMAASYLDLTTYEEIRSIYTEDLLGRDLPEYQDVVSCRERMAELRQELDRLILEFQL